MKSKFSILSKYRLDSHHSNCSEFLHEDLKEMIENDSVIIITDPEILEKVKSESKNLFEYTVTIESKDEIS